MAVFALAWSTGGSSAGASPPGRVLGVPGSAAARTAGAKDLGAAPSDASLTTQVYLAGRASALAAYATSVSKPGSPDYGDFLSPAQVQARFGATAQQVQAVERWLEAAGLRVALVSPHEITATGSVGDTDSAYDTQLDRFSAAGATFTASSRAASLPADVAGAVLSIGGLDSRPLLMRPVGLATQAGPVLPGANPGDPPGESPGAGHAQLPLSKGQDGAAFVGPTPCSSYYGQQIDTTDPEINGANQPYAICGYVPSQLRGAYGVSGDIDGQGVTVAIVDAYGSSTMPSDANTYATNHGDPAFSSGQYTQTVDPADWVDESECGGETGWLGEQSLDIEAVHAMAPGADVHYYGANSCNDPDFITTLTSIIDNHSADVISDSWGEVIYSSTGNESATAIAEYTSLFEQAATEGIEVMFSAGDCGDEDPSTSCGTSDTSTTPQADFPTSDPWVTSVGGTSTEIGASNQVEGAVPWGDDAWLESSGAWDSYGWIYGGGGGTSQYFTQPSYQQGVVPTTLAETLPDGTTTTQPMRVVPDIAMDADPFTGFLIGYTGGSGYAESDIGGTSLASPLLAGLVADGISRGALAEGFINPTLYRVYAGGSLLYDDIVTPSTTSAPYDILPAYDGDPAIAVEMGDDQALKATTGYDDATGLGMPTPAFLTLGATSTAITSSLDPATLGQPVTFTANVTPVTSGAGTPPGLVQFYVDGSSVGDPVTLAAGAATSPAISDLTVGTHTVTAAYIGNSMTGFLASTSPVLSQVVGPAPAPSTAPSTATPTQLTALSLTQIGAFLSVAEMKAKLVRTDTGAPIAGETVFFTSGADHLCSATTDASGRASCSFSLMKAIGSLLSHGYAAIFIGNTSYRASTATGGLASNYSTADLSSTTLALAGDTVRVTLTCLSNGGSCHSVLDLYSTTGGLPAIASASSVKGKRATRLGAGRFTIPRGATRTESLRLNNAGRKLARARSRFTARLLVSTRTRSGANRTGNDTVQLERLKAHAASASSRM